MSTENNQPDMIAQVGEMISRITQGLYSSPAMQACTNNFEKSDDDRALLIASAILAVAAEVRDVRNELVSISKDLHVLARKSGKQ